MMQNRWRTLLKLYRQQHGVKRRSHSEGLLSENLTSLVHMSCDFRDLEFNNSEKAWCSEMSDVDVFVGNNTIIDAEVYTLWLEGFSAQEAVKILKERGIPQEAGVSIDLLMSDTLDHYRTFCLLERLLQNPLKLWEQLTFQINPVTQKMLVERYYEFDNTVIRELLGRKLSSRNRKDLEEISEKTHIQLKSCRRQFDNLKRVFKTVEEMKGFLVQNIQTHFLLSEELAKKYAAIVFITNNRFETGKKKLSYLTFDDFFYCANMMMANWSYSSADCKHDDMDVDLDREFLLALRELKVLTEKENLDEHKAIVCNNLQGKIPEKAYNDIDSNFKNMSRTIINIAYGLNHSKEVRDIFVDLVEKFIEPNRQIKWHHSDMNLFMKAYINASHEMDIFKMHIPNLLQIWDRYMNTVSSCILQMYHS